MKAFFTVNRIMYLSGALALCTAIVMNVTTQFPFSGFLPGIRWIDFAVNCISLCLCIFLFIYPEHTRLSYVLLFTEAGITVHIGFMGIGTILFAAGCTMIFVNGDFKMHYKRKIAVLAVYWLIVVTGLYFTFNVKIFLFEITLTFFCFGLLACLYKKLESKLLYLLPEEVLVPALKLPEKGSVLYPDDYGLSDRQIAFTVGAIINGETYEALACRYYVSPSVVKKDMAAVCKRFGVKNKEALRILLLQYKIRTRIEHDRA